MQKLFLEMMVHNPEIYVRVQNIFNIDNFHPELKPVAGFFIAHSENYNTLPAKSQITALTGVNLLDLDDTVAKGHNEWCMDEFEKFTQQAELERAILKAADLLEKGERTPIEKLIKDAVQISLTKDMGTDYFENPSARLNAIRDNNGQMSTGWPILDYKLYGGFNRGELNIFAGPSGSGKSLFMQNLAVNWIEKGLNGIFITLELNEELTSMRIDSMITQIKTKEIFKNIDKVDQNVKMKKKTFGSLQIKYLPAQSNVNDIRSYLREFQIQRGVKIDFICLDYLDLLMPVSVKVDPSNLFVKDKYISEEIRNLAKEMNFITVTASQLNRQAVEEVDFDHSMISGGISKIMTADNVFGIYTSIAMRERGKYQLQILKTRNSPGTGDKIELDFDVDTLRISDSAGTTGEPSMGNSNSAANILNAIKPTTTVTTPYEEPVAKINADVKSTKLKQMLGSLKNQ